MGRRADVTTTEGAGDPRGAKEGAERHAEERT